MGEVGLEPTGVTRILSPARLPVPPLARATRREESSPWTSLIPSLTLAAWAVALSWLAFWPLLGKPYAFDDLAVLTAVADWRAGRLDLRAFLFAPHNEHVLPALRLTVAASTAALGSSATVVHLLLAALHGLGGWSVGRLVASCGASLPISWAAASLFVVTATSFAPSAVWYLTGAVVTLSWVSTLLGTYAIVRAPVRPGLGVGLSLAGLGWSTGGLPGLVAPWAALLLAHDARRRRLWWAAGLALGAVLVLVGARALYANYAGIPFPSPQPRGVLATAILIGSAPARAVQAFWPSAPNPVANVAGWSLAGLGLVWAPPRLRRVTVAVFAGAAALSLALGLMRPEYRLPDFAGADRYYYPLLAPWCLAVAGCLGRVRGRVLAWLVVAACSLPIATGRGYLMSHFPATALVPFEEYWTKTDRLVEEIAAEARAGVQPWRLSDGLLPVEGIPGLGLRLSALASTASPRPVAGERFDKGAGAEDQRRQNMVLDRWAVGLGGAATPWCVRDGTLVDAAVRAGSWVDFASGPYAASAVSGLEAWSAPFRFMTDQPAVLRLVRSAGDLEVTAWVPVLRPDHPAIQLTAQVDGRVLGPESITPGGVRTVRFANSSSATPAGSAAPGETVDIVLRAAPAWRPVDHQEGNGDARRLTIALLRAGFAQGAQPPIRPDPDAPFRCADANR